MICFLKLFLYYFNFYSYFQINIVCINSSLDSIDEPFICCPSGAIKRRSDFTFTIPEELEALFEVQTIDENEYSIDGYLKKWLNYSNNNSENVRIFIKSKENIEELVIKCDSKKAIIDLKDIPISQDLNSKPIKTFDSLTNICINDRTIDLRSVGLVRTDGLCDSVVFGIPFILNATKSPKLSFNELELNSHRFQALIEVMNEKNVFIILEMNSKQEKSFPNSFYALMSSMDTKSLVLKSIATKELLLPYFIDSIDTLMSTKVPKEVVDSVRQSLDVFPVNDVYNPLYINNNFFQFLSKKVI